MGRHVHVLKGKKTCFVIDGIIIMLTHKFSFVRVLFFRAHDSGARTAPAALALLFAQLIHPAPLVIDHHHFQYNGVSLGLALAAFALFAAGRDLVACAVFVASIMYKQMGLYYAPAVFGFLLTRGFSASGEM
jgi:alpha-1,3-glucosyltransferase